MDELKISFASDDLINKATAKVEKGVIIGDCHDDPKIDKERFRLAGEYVADTQPDFVVFIGDTATFDSCNSHDKNHTRKGKEKSSIIEDCESLKKAILAFMKPIFKLQEKQKRDKRKQYKPKIVITLGNHEHRFERFINENPEMAGMYERDLLSVFIQAGFEVYQYGDYFTYHDMSYTHTPFNGMGKPFGGVNMGRSIAMNVTFNITHGHRHTAYEYIEPKISDRTDGRADSVNIICTGSFLPVGYVEDYAAKSQAAWTNFLTEQKFINGKYKSTSRISLEELELMY